MLSNKVREIMTTELTTAPASTTIQEVMEKLVMEHVDAVLLTENGILTGIFTERHVLKYVTNFGLNPKATTVSCVMTSPIRSVTEQTSIVEALGEMLQRRIRHLLVRAEDNDRIVGIISMRLILQMVVEIGHCVNETQTVGEIISPDPISVDQATAVSDALELMNQKDTGAVVITCGKRPAGIFTERDLLQRVVLREKEPRQLRIEEVMISPVITMPRTTAVGKVLDEMQRRSIRNMPVCGDGGELVGLVSMSEIIQYAQVLDTDDAVRRAWKEVQEFYDSQDIYTPG